jgi:DNA-binding NarL/FixJ family response regulator
MPDAAKKLIVVDDHPIVRRGLQQLIDTQPDLVLVGSAATSTEALDLVGQENPDLAIIDVNLSNGNGIELVKQLNAHHANLSVLMISMYDETLYAERALAAGAKGYIMKQASDEQMLQAIRRVLEGRLYVSDDVRKENFTTPPDQDAGEVDSPIDRLSDRELEVFLLLGRGFAPRHIAEKLSVSVKTVESHRRHLKDKLNIDSSAELTRYAIEWCRTEAAPK